MSGRYFLLSKKLHKLSSRHACAIANVRITHGIFNIKFAGANFGVLKTLSIRNFKARLLTEVFTQ